jgi:hypothetical protein
MLGWALVIQVQGRRYRYINKVATYSTGVIMLYVACANNVARAKTILIQVPAPCTVLLCLRQAAQLLLKSGFLTNGAWQVNFSRPTKRNEVNTKVRLQYYLLTYTKLLVFATATVNHIINRKSYTPFSR